MFSTLRASVISWIGIAGGALTLLANVQKVFTLADWAHWITSTWSLYVFSFWRTIFGVFRLHIDPQAIMSVAMSVFVMMIAIGTWASNRAKPVGREEWPAGWQNIFNRQALIALGLYLASFVVVALISNPALIQSASLTIWGTLTLLAVLLILLAAYLTSVLLVLHAWPRGAKITTAIALLFLDQLFYSGSGQLAADPAASSILSSLAVVITSIIAAIIVVCLAPPRAFANRLIYVFIGLALLLILNELSKFGFASTEPGTEPTNPGSTGEGGALLKLMRVFLGS